MREKREKIACRLFFEKKNITQEQIMDRYVIREHKKKGLMSPEVSPMPWREGITIAQRAGHASVGQTLKLYN